MPKSRWGEIRKAEKNTPEGNRIFEELKEEYKQKYIIDSKVADLEYGMENK
jgi:orotidine-5'-phosphate decarboxylase